MRRVAFIWLPDWAVTQTLKRLCASGAPGLKPFALVARGAGGDRLVATDAAAAALGLHPGQLLAGARALAPELHCAAHDPRADAQALRRLARWCGRFSPAVAPARGASAPAPGEAGLFLETSGVDHLFGGEAGLLDEIARRLSALGLLCRLGLGDTPGLAWAAARHLAREGPARLAPGVGLQPLLALPASALRLPDETVRALRAVGLKRVDQIVAAPRASLARRFGRGLLDQLDAAAGAGPEPINPLPAPPVLLAQRKFASPLLTLEALEAAAARLAEALARRLQPLGLGARRMALRLYRADGAVAVLAVGAARPMVEPAPLARLLAERLRAAAPGLDLGFGVDAADLVVRRAERLEAVAQPLDPAAAAEMRAAAGEAALLDRLAARLGPCAVARAQPVARHAPEEAQRFAPHEASRALPFDPAASQGRPLFLFDPPEPAEVIAEAPDGPPRRFRWRRRLHDVAGAEGPERIASDWRKGGARLRDYYRVETKTGLRLWLARAGLPGRDAGPGRWFVHGAFG
jgi:protein ImuB